MPIRWSNVLVIFQREVRDQLRDRRTVFMIFVLPMLLYPILIIGAAQIRAASETRTRTVVLVGAEHLPAEPPLLNEARDGFLASLFDAPDEARRLSLKLVRGEGQWLDPAFRERATRGGAADAVVTFPADLTERIAQRRAPQISLDYNSADERSQLTYLRLKEVMKRWQDALLSRRLAADALPPSYTEPVELKPVDVATPAELGSSIWSRLFPFLLVMMSLTGAFYPAVDLCAGEKERGTMETLLISPASRAEIVLGKFFTVMLASVLTALLNLGCMALTGLRLAQQIGASAGSPDSPGARRAAALIAPPSFETAFWIVLLLLPLAAFFSALCVALAVLARSMKEGQYYMTPLYLVCLPLMFLTLAPEVELNLFYSLVPITGVALLLKSLIQADYVTAGRFFLPVLVPTTIYGALALRWAIDQFQREDVLFREAERFDLRSWVRHLLRDKGPTPTGSEALLCFTLMISTAWFFTQYVGTMALDRSTTAMAAGQIAFILTPPLAMGFILTSSPRQTLRLYWPASKYLGLAAGLAVALNPLVHELGYWVERYFPISQTARDAIAQLMGSRHDLPTALLLFALVPAVCEEVAFRGYVLSGLESAYRPRTAVLLSAILFGIMHVLMSLFQQLFNATLLGLVLGLLAVRSRSLLPGIVFHLLNNGLAVSLGAWTATPAGKRAAAWLYRDVEHGRYHWLLVAAGLAASAWLLGLLLRRGVDDDAERPASVSAG